jgi:hypothetical protein
MVMESVKRYLRNLWFIYNIENPLPYLKDRGLFF